MEKKYWLGRKRSAMAMARSASDAEARLIHYDLAGRYSVLAAQCLPFLLAAKAAPAGDGERAVLRAPQPVLRANPGPGRGEPGEQS